MKKTVLYLCFMGFMTNCFGQVGINTTAPGVNSVLELRSEFSGGNYGGFMPPKVTEAQRNTIPMTALNDGLIAYVSFPDGSKCLQEYNSQKLVWISLKCFDPLPVWTETMGTPGGSTDATTWNGYDNYATSTYTSTSSTVPQVKIVGPASNTTGASGGGYLFFTGPSDREFTISGINATSSVSPLTLKLLILKESTTPVTTAQNATGSELTIEYFNSATTSWTNVTVTDLPTGVGTDNTWYARTLSVSVPNTISRIRFTRTTAGGGPTYRIDDIRIVKP